jgi:hypothetical protein
MNNKPRIGFKRLVCGLIAIFVLVCLTACSNDEAGAKKAVEAYLKNHGVQSLKVDLFCEDPSLPNQAYISVTATYNFADSKGTPQREFLGYVVKQTGEEWAIMRNTTYTTQKAQGLSLLTSEK